uniref:NADH dehydrogenase subunit 6 n=1 Tax=Haemaphysalis bispinosa TaxID=1340770 RepID=UPI0023AA85EB|nr:NADH dehydrogenase subunit 6 [Haemaphysalis bispinosa]WCD42305.1 NADH dehydrogenase subunit 6 [Haemaphysalis bispinosa]
MYYFLKISMIMIMSIFFMMMIHPIMMLMSIMLLTLYMALMFYFFCQFSLVSLIMTLLILGGMLIIFMYMVSLSPNNKISLNWMMFSSLPFFFIFMKWELNMENVKNEILNKMYFSGFMNLVMLMMIYLIITLFIVLKLTNSNMTPMKMTYGI